MMGNPVIKKIKNYRKIFIIKIVSLFRSAATCTLHVSLQSYCNNKECQHSLNVVSRTEACACARVICALGLKDVLGPVHTYPFLFENGDVFLRLKEFRVHTLRF